MHISPERDQTGLQKIPDYAGVGLDSFHCNYNLCNYTCVHICKIVSLLCSYSDV